MIAPCERCERASVYTHYARARARYTTNRTTLHIVHGGRAPAFRADGGAQRAPMRLASRPVNETRMLARWRLGQLLAKEERGVGPGRGKEMSASQTSFRTLLGTLGLDKSAALEAQRIGTLPEGELKKAFADARDQGRLTYFTELIVRARPFWYKASREARHREIKVEAAKKTALGTPGPFPLIYADPPWKFEIYSAKGLERTPDQHYPTLSDEEIKAFRVAGRPISEIAHKNAALFLWCTSSNVKRAIEIMEAWDFTFKASAVWVKDKSGLGLVFRNQHELLLYGTRGAMPGPQHQPPSVFRYPRLRHSEKPRQVRAAIEKMYPDFDERTRLELFSRDKVKGWTGHGFES